MTALKAHVVNGRIVVDDPVDLPEGAEVEVYMYTEVPPDEMPPEERAALEASLDRGLAQIKRGELIDADEVLAELRR